MALRFDSLLLWRGLILILKDTLGKLAISKTCKGKAKQATANQMKG